MSGKTILILGGGIGGIAAAGALRRLCAPEHRVVVIERNAKFSLRMANLWLMTGERQRPEEGERDLSRLIERGIEWVQAEIEGVDPAAKTVKTSAGALTGDYLVIALGAERHPEAVPGFAEAALDLYEASGALRIHQALESLRRRPRGGVGRAHAVLVPLRALRGRVPGRFGAAPARRT